MKSNQYKLQLRNNTNIVFLNLLKLTLQNR